MRTGWMYIFLFSVWGSPLGVGGLPTVHSEFLTPEADRKEGGEVRMRCTAANLQLDHIVEWRTVNRTLSWGEMIYAHTDPRYNIHSQWLAENTTNVIVFSITDLQRKDTNDYICNVRLENPAGGTQIIATDKLTLSVLYFPNEAFPLCSPAGPLTVLSETVFKIKCLSEIANPEVSIDVITDQTRAFSWSSSGVDNTALRSLDLTVGVAENGLQFTCTITSPMYFQGRSRSCTIGPIQVVSPLTAPVATVTTPTASPGLTTSILVGSLAGGVALLLLILVIYAMCLCKRKPKPHTTVTKTQSLNTETTPKESRHQDGALYENTGLPPISEEPVMYQNLHHNINLECRFPDSVKNSKPTDSTGAVDRFSFNAKPNKVKKKTPESAEKRRRQDRASGVSTEQSYSNPVFDSGDLDGGIASRISTVDVIPKSQTPRRAFRSTEDGIDSGGYSEPDIQMLPSEEVTGTSQEHPKGGRHVRITTPQTDNGQSRKSSLPRSVDTDGSHSTSPEQTGTRRPSYAAAYAETDLLSGTESGRRLAPTDSPDYAVLNETS